MTLYRKKPISALKFDGSNQAAIDAFIGARTLNPLQSVSLVSSDYVALSPNNTYTIISEAVFENRFEEDV
jgi:hypothetical protein